MRRAIGLLVMMALVGACKREVAGASASTSTSTSTSATGISASASARTPRPAISNAWVTCAADVDCVAVPSACCDAWPSNVASLERVRAAVAASDATRAECRDRVCAMRVPDAACDRGRCVVR